MKNTTTKQSETQTETGTKKVPNLADRNELKHLLGQRFRAEFAQYAFEDGQIDKITDDVTNEFYLDTVVCFVVDRIEKRTLAAFGNKRWWADRLASAAINTAFLGAAVGGAFAISKNMNKPLFGGQGSVGQSPFSSSHAATSAPRSLRGVRRESSNLSSATSAS